MIQLQARCATINNGFEQTTLKAPASWIGEMITPIPHGGARPRPRVSEQVQSPVGIDAEPARVAGVGIESSDVGRSSS